MFFDKKSVVIEESDILWRFYCKDFQLTDRPVVAPRNFCQYFWGSVGGFILWVEKEMDLRKVWLLGCCLFLLTFLIGVLNARFWKSFYIDAGVFTVLLSSVFLTGIPTILRISGWINRMPKWTQPVVALGILLVIVLLVWLVDRSSLDLLVPLIYIVPGFVILGTILVCLAFLFPKMKHRLPNRLLEVFEIFRMYIVSVKGRVCIEVRAPQPQSPTGTGQQ